MSESKASSWPVARSTPTVRDKILYSEEGAAISIVVGSEQWLAWLNEETSSTFAFRDGNGSYTARKERVGNRRGGWYWKAYRKYQGRLYRTYLGKSEDLTLERLREVAYTLAARIAADATSADDDSEEERQAQHQKPQASNMAPLLKTKLYPPQLPTWLVERASLFAQLDGSLRHKLTVVQAPAGFGKTTLVNHWLASRGVSPDFPTMCWVSLDSGDNDLMRFWRAVMTAAQRLLGQEQQAAGQAALALLTVGTYSLFESPPLELALTRLLNSFTELDKEGLLIFDDYHAISDAAIHETLAFFIEHLPKTIHVLLLTRSEPDLPLLRWRARGELFELYKAELRFSHEEMVAFLQQALPVTFSEVALSRLDTLLEGWVAGLRLLALTFARWKTPQSIEQALVVQGQYTYPQRHLLDYFMREILETQPAELQSFLLHTSVLSRLSGSLCDTITESENSKEKLEAISRAGLFLDALEGPETWYRYHALFAEALRQEARRRLGEETLAKLWRRASVWYEQEAMFIEAIEMAWLAQDMERVAELIEQLEIQYFYEPISMRSWLEQLPESVLRKHPLLCHILAVELRFPVEYRFSQTAIPASKVVLLTEDERIRVEKLLQMAVEGWTSRGMYAAIGANRAFLALSAMLGRETFSSVVKHAYEALAYLSQEDELSPYLLMYRSSSLSLVGLDKLRLGRLDEARQDLLQAEKDNLPPSNRYLNIQIRLALGKTYLLLGELRQASRYQQHVLSEAKDLNDDVSIADALLELAWVAFETNELVDAEIYAKEVNRLMQGSSLPESQALSRRAALQLALLQYARGEIAVALEQLKVLLANPWEEWTPESLLLHARTYAWYGRLLIAAGNPLMIQDGLEMKFPSGETEAITEQLEVQILRGRLLLARGEGRAALLQFTHLLIAARENQHGYHAVQIQILLALAHAACNQHKQAHYWLRQALLQTMQEGYVRLFLDEGRSIITLLRALLPTLQHEPTLRSYVQRLLQATSWRSGLAQKAQSTFGSPFFVPLSEQEERVLQLLAAGWSNQEIARELIISVNTVKYHVKHLYQKLGVSNRLQASEVARDLIRNESSVKPL
ncbi:hypothetical protein EPA93_16445 [Ktedonosporobacter rubrisoli]|uniref:HTH luxR-type domain-containing protein n=1 Tax=Ktedonosporobacter rubrisoli TaxID=2509675 RepID=A0A4P6JQD5_KTERU|nr:LuxR C-terminal-related transcriptional regulator [Ktedonosporobacter rubrisoli]QBD77494.1 hypothetical protein EPA93_16445 [Ktedonosporobacter rubrisoli]